MKPSLSKVSLEQAMTPFDSYCLDESDDIYHLLKQMINGNHPGILATVDATGHPHMRWMSTLSLEELPHIYTLTSDKSRKIGEIEQNPAVNWMFTNSDLSLILNLTGKAKIHRDAPTLARIWKLIKDKSCAYFLKNCTEGPGYVVVETVVETIDCTTPQNSLRFRVDMNRLIKHDAEDQ